MQNKKNQSNVGQMIQRCHKWRQKRKQYIDQARQTPDEIERERLLQAAEHYGRMVNAEQGKIDSSRDSKEKAAAEKAIAEAEANNTADKEDEEESPFPDFITNLN
ncbi:MAG: hypothetical protein IKB05_04815 [Alphaproteobacteria bacterium]|nr:hypothetical protein [Alphaproteobacteria bacterium]MBQ3039073.1 hypothetical protein [Alphaproteobacteria bacterium]MBR2393781.1 hypothetical protein [Alphaproteobacteria bacterium]